MLQNNQDYINRRNRLIPFAEKFANNLHGETSDTEDRDLWCQKWNKAFHNEMNRLAHEAGLCKFV